MRAATLQRLLLLAAAGLAAVAAAEPLKVELYGESLCDDTAHYIVDVLGAQEEEGPLFDDGIAPLMKLQYHAYGNAKVNDTTGEVACQHGEVECTYNNVILCAQKEKPQQDAWFPLVRCLATPLTGNLTATDRPSYIAETSALVEAAAPGCAAETGFDLDALLACAEGPEGEELQAEAAAATAALQPAHTGVPWVVAAGQSLGGNTPTLAATGLFACAAADAAARPAACGQLALDVNAEA